MEGYSCLIDFHVISAQYSTPSILSILCFSIRVALCATVVVQLVCLCHRRVTTYLLMSLECFKKGNIFVHSLSPFEALKE
eukprot:1159553-Pelagomonas_calceolata.AAC.9